MYIPTLDPRLVGETISHFRKKAKMSQEVLSGLADIGRTHLSAIERGVRKPTLDTFFKLAEAMNIEPNKLMKLIEDELTSDSCKL